MNVMRLHVCVSEYDVLRLLVRVTVGMGVPKGSAADDDLIANTSSNQAGTACVPTRVRNQVGDYPGLTA